MNRLTIIVISVLVVAAIGGGWFYSSFMNRTLVDLSPKGDAKRAAQVEAQNEKAFARPEPKPRQVQAPNPVKNLYFGDLHVHTSLSFDSYLFGNRLTPEEAYRFANGEAIKSAAGETMQLARPLDFVALTDHAETFGLFEGCARDDISAEQRAFCDRFDAPSVSFFLELRNAGEQRPPQRPTELCPDNIETCVEEGKTTWAKIVETADAFYRPGEFTTFAAYEYSPPLQDSGKVHRNVIFRNANVPDQAFSAFDALTTLDLWRSLDRTCTGDCQVLTIPHNMNKMWGIAYSGKTIDGNPYTNEDWALRSRSEPLAEIFQIKGASECALGVGAVDEECAFEQYFPPCEPGQETKCIFPTSMVRDGLKIGLGLERDLGFNPLQFGFIGSTDTHNSSPGDTEEWDYRGASGLFSGPAASRYEGLQKGRPRNVERNPGGLAAVWAPENTREAIFDAMRAKETFATSGPRIALRFFTSWGYGGGILGASDMLAQAYRDGAPMGAVREARASKPQFLVWAMQDPDSAPIQKIQIIKGWIEGDTPKEQVIDIACAGGVQPNSATGRCPESTAGVDLSDCSLIGTGAPELKTVWTDEAYKGAFASFYYVRVLQNPTCRFSTYDALRLGEPPVEGYPATVQERAWSSPIWFQPN